MKYPKTIQNLIDQFSSLPTVGPKTAERYVFYLLRQNPEKLAAFSLALGGLKSGLKVCPECGALTENGLCEICGDKNRVQDLICVVANLQDMISLENTRQYAGRYFILGGLINTIEDVKPEDLNIKRLADRVNSLLKSGANLEIILALSPTLEGETTALYLAKLLKNPKIKVTRLARGLPTGSNLEYVDETTLSNALKYRNTV
jgi:recombination protein RecR